jgi:hypothetical protein
LAILHAENPNPRDDPKTQEKKQRQKRRETTTQRHACAKHKQIGSKMDGNFLFGKKLIKFGDFFFLNFCKPRSKGVREFITTSGVADRL